MRWNVRNGNEFVPTLRGVKSITLNWYNDDGGSSSGVVLTTDGRFLGNQSGSSLTISIDQGTVKPRNAQGDWQPELTSSQRTALLTLAKTIGPTSIPINVSSSSEYLQTWMRTAIFNARG